MSQHSGEKNKKLLQYILNVEDYPVKLRKERRIVPGSDRQLGASTIRDLEEGGRLKSILGNFTRDAGHVWNQAPKYIKEAKTLT